MVWKNLKIGKKLGIGFGVVIFLLIFIAIIGEEGISDILKNAKSVITGNRLDAILVQREIDHLNWVSKLNNFMTDEKITELKINTDDHKCDFGLWLYGDGRKEAENLIPSLIPKFKEIEEPHKKLHESAIDIRDNFRRLHSGLLLTLYTNMYNLINWTSEITKALSEEAGGIYIYQNQVKNIVDAAYSIIKTIDEDKSLGDINIRQQHAKLMIKKIRYGKDYTDYIWINDINNKMVMHPIKSDLDDKDLSDYKDPTGKKIFAEFTKICKEKGEGFINYLWPKPNSDQPVPKVSFVKIYKPWGWIIGTGVYIDVSNKNVYNRAIDFSEGKPFKIGIELDPSKCSMSKFINDSKIIEFAKIFPELKNALEVIKKKHEAIHISAKQITNLVNEQKIIEAINVFEKETKPLSDQFKDQLLTVAEAERNLRNNTDKANAIYTSVSTPSLKSIQKSISDIRSEVKKNIITDEIMLKSAKNTKQNMNIAIAVSILFGIIISVIITNNLKKPIQKGVEMAKTISTGDLTKKLDINQKDEIGVLADSLNEMTSKLKEIFNDLSDVTKNISSSSEELSTVSNQMASTSEEMNSQYNSIAAASEQVSVNVKSVASNAEQSTLSVTNIATMAEEMSATFNNIASFSEKTANNVNEMAKLNENLLDTASTAASAVEELTISLNEVAKNTAKGSLISKNADLSADGIQSKMQLLIKSSKQIEKIVGVIKNIADKTDMLALNATIEAAGAGEAGKGFAVVANEVKELAKQSAEATEEISSQIEEIQNNVDVAVKAIIDIGKTIKEIAEINITTASSVEEQNVTAKEISKSLTHNTLTVKDLSNKAYESANLVNEIATSINESSKTASSLAEHIEKLSFTIKDVANSVLEASNGVNDISASIQEINNASKESTISANETSNSSKELKSMVLRLSNILSKFIIDTK